MLNLSPVNALALEASANALIVNALTHGAPGLLAAPKDEVNAAHATVIAGASQVAEAWSSILRPLNILVRSKAVLIHGSPIVTFADIVTGKSDRRELADVLFVIDLIQGSNVADRRAVLTQAKVATKTGHIPLGASGEGQRNLYLHWPAFKMPKGYKSHSRDLNDKSCPGLAEDGCRFGGINLHRPPRDWAQIPTAWEMDINQKPSLGTSLADMALGKAGRQAYSGGPDPWSELVDELLAVSFGLCYPQKRKLRKDWETNSFMTGSNRPNGPRFMSRSTFFRSIGAPPDVISGDFEEPDPSGISTVHIELINLMG